MLEVEDELLGKLILSPIMKRLNHRI